jgi:hypothetical protein
MNLRETGEAVLLHPKRKVLPLDAGRWDMARAPYLSRGIAPRSRYNTRLVRGSAFVLAKGHVAG